MRHLCRNKKGKLSRLLFIGAVGWIMALLSASAQEGLPFYVNYSATDYGAHNRNFDVVCDSSGIPYFANFEGLLYFNGASWNKILTPGISRITKLYVDKQGEIWVGGYNYIGKIECSEIGSPFLKTYLSDEESHSGGMHIGEVSVIKESGDSLQFFTQSYKIVLCQGNILPVEPFASSDLSSSSEQILKVSDDWEVSNPSHSGLIIRNNSTGKQYQLTESNGLCSQVVNAMSYDKDGSVWIATDNGIARINLPSFYSHFTATEGLRGEVTTIIRHKGILYVGTLHGLFLYNGKTGLFEAIPEISQTCWQLKATPSGILYVATGDGLFRIEASKAVRIINGNLFSVAFHPKDESIFFIGELDGIHRKGHTDYQKIAPVEKAMKIAFYKGQLWAENLYGEIYRIEEGKEAQAIGMGQGVTSKSGNRMHMTQQGPFLLSLKGIQSWDEESEQFKPVQSPVLDSLMAGKDWWPGMMATSSVHKETWMTGGDYKGLIVFRDNQLDKEKISMLKPLRDYAIRTLYLEQDGKAWIGGDFGLVEFNPDCKDAAYSALPKVRIRQIMINNEQLFYDGATGGKAELLSQPQIKFGSSTKEFDFVFSSDANNLLGQTRYSYYLEGYENTWRPWAMETAKEYTNLSFGKYTFHLKTIDSFGRESEEATFSFTILRPFYLKWYCWIAYVGIAILLLLLFFKWRTHQLRQKTQWLEGVVEERTKQIRDQRDEIAEKSEKLGETLNELKKAQSMLIRQEKVATVGKLTQGLIDRILNPLNYIINFSHLSNLLLKEMKEDLDDEEDRITEDNYDDMTEILGMLNTHLTKIEEHGNSTARILKAMEELLADHSCHFDRVDINKLITHNLTILKEYYQKEIKETGISFEVNLPDLPIEADVDKLLLGKVIMSILQNGIYALQRKKKKEAFDALLKIKLRQEGQLLRIELCDNGIGIESAILEKVFDPFFTTKTTAEAAGVGLYLSREIILNHNGKIEVRSEKDKFTEFAITIPIHQSLKTNDDE